LYTAFPSISRLAAAPEKALTDIRRVVGHHKAADLGVGINRLFSTKLSLS
jgi:hypothetical protein